MNSPFASFNLPHEFLGPTPQWWPSCTAYGLLYIRTLVCRDGRYSRYSKDMIEIVYCVIGLDLSKLNEYKLMCVL